MPYEERDITKDPSALEELRRLALLTTPVVLIDGEPVVGFDEKKLRERLEMA